MIRSHWNLPVRTPLGPAPVLFGNQGPHCTNHICVTLEMGRLKKIGPRSIRSGDAFGIAQMREMDAGPMRFDKCRPIKIFRDAQGSGTQRGAIGLQIYRVQHRAVIGRRGHHPRQAQK